MALFNSFGANATWIPITSTNGGGNDQANVDLTKQQTGIFFSTGTRSRIPTALKPRGVDTPVMTAIRELLSKGGVVSGNSAGMAVFGCFNQSFINSKLDSIEFN